MITTRKTDSLLIRSKERKTLPAPTVVMHKGRMYYMRIHNLSEYTVSQGMHDLYEGNIFPGSESGWQRAKLYYCQFRAWRQYPDWSIIRIELTPQNPKVSWEKLLTAVDIDTAEDRLTVIRTAILDFYLDFLKLMQQYEESKTGELPF